MNDNKNEKNKLNSEKSAALRKLDEIFLDTDANVLDIDESEYEERDYKPIRGRRDGKIGCLGGLMYFVFVVSLSIILACFGWMAAVDVLALNKEYIETEVVLPLSFFSDEEVESVDDDGVVSTYTVTKANISSVAQALKDAGIIEYPWLFKLYCAVSNADVKLDAGAYEMNTEYDYRAIVNKMQIGSGATVTISLTFPEGYTIEQMFELLADESVSTEMDLYAAASDYTYSYSFLGENTSGDFTRLEGYMFPDTYEFYIGEQASSVINKFLQNFNTKFTADMYNQLDNSGYTLDEIITIASMIEAEAANDDERAMIASVIYNRLASGMALQIDATVQYALDERKEVLTVEDLAVDSPYNTYLYTGLPPGAISNPGLASIQAALQPAETEYYFYALDTETGTHRFFETYTEHQNFVNTQDYSS